MAITLERSPMRELSESEDRDEARVDAVSMKVPIVLVSGRPDAKHPTRHTPDLQAAAEGRSLKRYVKLYTLVMGIAPLVAMVSAPGDTVLSAGVAAACARKIAGEHTAPSPRPKPVRTARRDVRRPEFNPDANFDDMNGAPDCRS
jgi:hypothetical protein